ncbi:MAG: caspase family protein [Sphingobacteriales bacterium]|nr:caspase family protein [Sphingobacteriales bacterium]
MLRRYFLCSLIQFCLYPVSFTQTKRALIIGINDYYTMDGFTKTILPDTRNSLHGCVNDAKSIKELISSRFRFRESFIKELYNKQANKQNILDELDKLLAVSKAGDQVFFYYSGHGLQLKNAVTKSTDEAIAPSDALYNTNGFIRTLQLAAIFNQFVDKKVILTTVFDCCYSWGTHTMIGKEEPQTDFGITISANIPGIEESFSADGEDKFVPVASGTFSERETRGLDYNEFMNLSDFTPDSLYLLNKTDSSFSLFSFLTVNPFSSDTLPVLYKKDSRSGRFIPANVLQDNEREFKMQGNLIGDIFSGTTAPSNRMQSNYLFLSATNDVQKAVEKPDENGNRHGVFTKALIEVFKRNSANISGAQLFEKISAELKKRFYGQTPTLKCDPHRLKKNLISTSPASVSDLVLTKCIQSSGKTILLNKGALAGLSAGNILDDISHSETQAEVKELKGDNTCIAILKKGSGNMKGHTFKVSSWYTKTAPLIRVYIPHDKTTGSQLNTLVQNQIKPLIKEQDMNGPNKGYGYYVPFEENFSCSKIFMKGNQFPYIGLVANTNALLPDLTKGALQKVNQNQPYIVYLPVPEEIAKATEFLCRKNQNIELVSDPEKADISISCFYSRNINKNKDYLPGTKKINNSSPYYRSGLAPALQEQDDPDVNILLALTHETVGDNIPKRWHSAQSPFLVIHHPIKEVQSIAEKIYHWFIVRSVDKGVWLNDWQRK